MTEKPGKPVAGAAVICLDHDRVLLVQRGREPHRGRWSFPGGKIEPGEMARQAAERETFEETGLRVRVLDVVDVYDAIFPPFHYCVADYLAVTEGEWIPRPGGDVMDARWVSFVDLDDYDLTEAMRVVLDRARWLMSIRAGAPPSLGIELDTIAPAGVKGRYELRSKIQGLYVITDDTLSAGRSHVEIARAALDGGARLIQLRDKRRDAGEILPIACEIRELCHAAGALFIINDRVDLACACEADGVHLGQTDLPAAEARKLLGPDRLIGVSVENVGQATAAEAADADYLGVGAIFGSATKQDAGDAVGLDHLRALREGTSLPIVAIGGITLDRISDVREAGADSIAVIGAVASADNPAAAAWSLAAACEKPAA
jgi:thiamine-phosphate pyrophosphorylase